jgi:glutaredoxin
MMKVMKEIVRRQADFFEKGELFMKPLTLKTVADAIEVHESTVSRTVREKYVQTPHGLYELKFFFSNGLEQSSQDITASTVKTIIEQMIEQEDKLAPLSDQKIVSKLSEEHQIDVSRRTILGCVKIMLLKMYSRNSCPLCTEALEELEKLKNDMEIEIEVVDIYSDDALLEKYQLMIPVVEYRGLVLGYGKIKKDFIRKRLLDKKRETIVE